MIETTINDAPTMRDEAERGTMRLRPGDEILGRYAVQGELGQGGMGVVYKCLDKVGGVEVAVKGLPPEVSHNADEMEEVRDNYRLVQGLRHPNICGIQILEKDARGDYYLVMDLAHGVNLNRWLRQHPDATDAQKIAILRQIAAALDYAHARKIIHRDVKPENVMVAEDGAAQVLDFGIAAQVRSSLSRTSQAVTSKSGTPGYKAPEQWRGQPQSAAADQYALGALAYKLFAGRLPFEGDDLVILGQAVLNEPVPKIPTASSTVNAVLVKALAKQPDGRFTSCGAFVDALEGRMRFATKRPLGKIATVAVLLALLAGGGIFYKHQVDMQEAARVAKVEADRKAAREKAEAEVKRLAEAEAAREKAEAEAKRLAEEKAAREKAEAEAKKPKPPAIDETKVQQGIAELRRLRTLIDIKRTGLRESVGKVAPYRDDADGFAAHLATVDAAAKELENVTDPADVPAAKALVARLQTAADAVAVELKWLETNKTARDRAKALDGELASLEPELARCKAAETVPTRLAEGRGLQTAARKLLADGAFEDAARKFGEAKAKLDETVAAAKAFQFKLALDEGRAYADASQWEKALAAAERALAWDAASEDARKLKSEVESHLTPSLKLVVQVEGREVEGAQVTVDGKVYTSPVELKNLEKGSNIVSFLASYEAGGKRYRQTFAALDVDWSGPKTLALTLPEVKEPQPGEVKAFDLPNGVRMKFAWCPAGTFTMGSPTGEAGRDDGEAPHRVTLTKGFWMGQFEVTQAQWEGVMGDNPSSFKGDANRPVEKVSWNDCQLFIAKCNELAKNMTFSLPTEAQWEYACRTGSTGPYAGTGNLDEMGWYDANSGSTTHPVGQKRPNAWNLYDMHGNVWEWCADGYEDYGGDCTDPTRLASGSYRVLRGGGWDCYAQNCRSAYRYDGDPSGNYSFNYGFRLCCSAGLH